MCVNKFCYILESTPGDHLCSSPPFSAHGGFFKWVLTAAKPHGVRVAEVGFDRSTTGLGLTSVTVTTGGTEGKNPVHGLNVTLTTENMLQVSLF